MPSKRQRAWAEFRADPFVKWIKSLPCVVGRECVGPIDPNHHPTVGSTGRVHRRIFPLCRKHHTELAIGVQTFQIKYGLDFNAIMDQLEERYRCARK